MKLVNANTNNNHEPNYLDSGWVRGLAILQYVFASFSVAGCIIYVFVFNDSNNIFEKFIPVVIVIAIIEIIVSFILGALIYRLAELTEESNILNSKVAELEMIQQRRTQWVNGKLSELESAQRRRTQMDYDLNAKVTELEVAQDIKMEEMNDEEIFFEE